MARRILFVETTSHLRDPEKELFVDAHVQVDWKYRVAIDPWTGDVQGAAPTYKVRPLEPYPSEFNEYGILSEPDEIAWLEKAMTKPSHDNSYEGIKIVSRVHELGVRDTEGKKGFRIEVLTGNDAENFLAAEKRAATVTFAKEHWWQIGIGLVVALWWFF